MGVSSRMCQLSLLLWFPWSSDVAIPPPGSEVGGRDGSLGEHQ